MSTESDIENSTRAARDVALTATPTTSSTVEPPPPPQSAKLATVDEAHAEEADNQEEFDVVDNSEQQDAVKEPPVEQEEVQLKKAQKVVEVGTTTVAIEQSAAQVELTAPNKDKMDGGDSFGNFKLLFVLAQLFGLTAIGLVGGWVGKYMGGVAGRGTPSLEFNWHPLFMTIGLIFLYGNSILIYRGFRNMRKKQLKLLHAGIHMGALIFTIIALVAVFDSHNLVSPPIANLYSIHSWIGLSAVIVFVLQYVFGFLAYLVPGFKDAYKIAYMPLHIYFGLFGFVLSIAAAIAGLNEKLIFNGSYDALPTGSVIGNLVGLFCVIFGALVVYLVTEPSYKRKPIPEDVVLLTGVRE